MAEQKSIQDQLLEPFDIFDIEWRVQQAGQNTGKVWAMVLAYVTNRAIMERLDDVFGIGGWQNEYQFMPDGGVVCGLKCRVPINDNQDTEWVVKYDGADRTAIEAVKGGLSNAMKRAGVQWGIGRYLYKLDTTFVTLIPGKMPHDGDYIPCFVKLDKNDKGQRYYFPRPTLPKFALKKEQA